MVEEVEREDSEEEKEATGSGKLLSCVQELEDKLKYSDQKRMELSRDNMALQEKLKASQEEEDHIRQEMVSLKQRLLSVLSSEVRRMMVLNYQTDHQECCVIQAFLCVGGAASPSPHISLPERCSKY